MNLRVLCDFAEDNPRLSHDHYSKEKTFEMIKILNDIGYTCEYFGGVPELLKLASKPKINQSNYLYLNFSDGLEHEYSRIQVPLLCELLNLKYSGSTPFVAGLMSNKHFSKCAANDIGISTPKGILINKNTCFKELLTNLQFPVIIKPNNEGSSIGINNNSVVYTCNDAYNSILNLIKIYNEILVEEYIEGIDVSNFIIGNTNDIMLNKVLIYKTHGNFIQKDHVRGEEEKQHRLSEILLFENVIDNYKLLNDIRETSLKYYNYINARDIARIDYRIKQNGDIVFLEINSMPTISPTSDAGSLCKEANIPYEDFLKMIIQSASKRYQS